MGLLEEGLPLSWNDTKYYAAHVKTHGIIQFINQYHKQRQRKNDSLLWGDEVECMLVKFDHKNKTARLSLKASKVLQELNTTERKSAGTQTATWRPEYGDYMLESSPAKPYTGNTADLTQPEYNMKMRRNELKRCLETDEFPITLTTFPRLGCFNCTDPVSNPTPDSMQSHSRFISEKVRTRTFPKYRLFEQNIRERRGKPIQINIPVFKDIHTADPLQEDLSKCGNTDKLEREKVGKKNHIFMDHTGFGAGSCCLQVTVQAGDIQEAKYLYDQLINLSPIMVALSAAAPVHRGYLSDLDTRWPMISQSLDDRTDEELGLKVLKENKFVINKSRYDSVDSYLTCSACSDIDLVYDKDAFDKLKHEGVDDMLSKHIAHLFIRDPLMMFRENIYQNDDESTGHFENIQSTNWQSLRFKLPAPGCNAGWQIEFRPMDVQLTDFENAAYIVFILLTSRVILTFGLNIMIPISKADDNFSRSHKKDAVTSEKFYFRNDLSGKCSCENTEEAYDEMTVNEIVNGKEDFMGLIALINRYLDMVDVDVLTRRRIKEYLVLISHRASGKLKTMARWIRDFVLNHEDYQQDSVVSETINYDLLLKCVNVPQEKNFDFELFSNETFCYKDLFQEQNDVTSKDKERRLTQRNAVKM